MIENERLITIKLASKILGIKPETLYQWNWLGKNLPFIKIGRAIRVREKDLKDFIDNGKRFPKHGTKEG